MTAPKINKLRIKKEAKAPFAGLLLTDAAMAKIISDHEKKLKDQKLEIIKLKTQHDVELKACNKLCEVKIKSDRLKYIACKDDMIRQEKIITASLNQKVPWYKSSTFSIILGSIIAGGGCAGIVAASD